MSENIENIESKNEVESKGEAKFDESAIWKLVSNVDPKTGEDLDWIMVKEYLVENGPVKGLEKVFEYYEMKNPKMDPWVNYLLACSHFTEEELNGTPMNRAYRRRLESKIAKLMKMRGKDKNTSLHQFLYDNRNVTV